MQHTIISDIADFLPFDHGQQQPCWMEVSKMLLFQAITVAFVVCPAFMLDAWLNDDTIGMTLLPLVLAVLILIALIAVRLDQTFVQPQWKQKLLEAQAPWDALSDMGRRELERVREQGRTE